MATLSLIMRENHAILEEELKQLVSGTGCTEYYEL